MARKQLRFVMTARMKSARRRETQGKSRKMPIPRYPGFQEKTQPVGDVPQKTTTMQVEAPTTCTTEQPTKRLKLQQSQINSYGCQTDARTKIQLDHQIVLRLQSAIQHRLTSRVEENHRNALSRLPGTEMATKTLPILLNRGSKCPFLFNTLPSLKPGWSTAHI